MPGKYADERSLVLGIKDGEEEAYRVISSPQSEYGQAMWSAIKSVRIKKSEMEDVFAETLVKVYTKRSTIKVDGGNFRAWLYTIARYTAIDHQKASQGDILSEAEILKPGKTGRRIEPPVEIANTKNAKRLREGLSHLSSDERRTVLLGALELLEKQNPQQHQVFTMRYAKGMLPTVIAEELGLSSGNVSTLLNRAESFLARTCLSDSSSSQG